MSELLLAGSTTKDSKYDNHKLFDAVLCMYACIYILYASMALQQSMSTMVLVVIYGYTSGPSIIRKSLGSM